MLIERYDYNELILMGNQIASGKKNVPVSSLDALIIVNLSSALQKDGKERERLLDRLLGKAVMRIGGETAGEAIKIASASAALDIENITDDRLHGLIEALEGVAAQRAKQAEGVTPLAEILTIEHVEKTVDNGDNPEANPEANPEMDI